MHGNTESVRNRSLSAKILQRANRMTELSYIVFYDQARSPRNETVDLP